MTEAVRTAGELPNLYVTDFIKDMAAAYAASDLVISRAGAGSISEFCLLHKPVVLVPSPNVAEDHRQECTGTGRQTSRHLRKDSEAEAKLMDVALNTVADDRKLKELSENIAKLACRLCTNHRAGSNQAGRSRKLVEGMQKSQLSQLGLTKKSVESPISSFQKEENENTTDFGGHPQLKVVPTLIKT